MITSAELREIVDFGPGSHLTVSDREYKTVSETDIKKIEKKMKIIRALFPYKPETRDCDDFAKIAKTVQILFCPGRAFGEIYANNLGTENRHAVNIFINDKKQKKYYEPQSGKVFDTTPTGFIETNF